MSESDKTYHESDLLQELAPELEGAEFVPEVCEAGAQLGHSVRLTIAQLPGESEVNFANRLGDEIEIHS